MQYLLATRGYLVFICLICAFMFVILLGFWAWHMYLIIIGTTTNELSKLSQLKWALGEKYRDDCAEYAVAVKAYEKQQEEIKNDRPLASDEEILEQPEQPEDLRYHLKRHRYHMGWWRNLLLVCFPPDIHSEAFCKVGDELDLDHTEDGSTEDTGTDVDSTTKTNSSRNKNDKNSGSTSEDGIVEKKNGDSSVPVSEAGKKQKNGGGKARARKK